MLPSSGLSTPAHAQSDSSSGRQVNNLLHALRGEQFRHAQNVAHRRTRRPGTSSLTGSLPPLVTLDPAPLPPSRSLRPQKRPAAGPAAPMSWTKRSEDAQALQDGPAYRADAFSVLFNDTDVPPTARNPALPLHEHSLVHLCLRVLLDLPAEVALPVLAELPGHLRRHIMLHTAVHAPLPADILRILLADEGSVSGEVVLGRAYPPAWLVRAGVLQPHGPSTITAGAGSDSDRAPSPPSRDDDWDASSDGWSDGDASSPPLHTLALLSHQLSPAHISSLPSSLTRLALLAQPQPIPLHRLPALLPHLVLLDVSFNTWLGAPYVDVEAAALDDTPTQTEEGAIWKSAIERIEWTKWRRLTVLGLRECGLVKEMQESVVKKVQMGRLEDVRVYL